MRDGVAEGMWWQSGTVALHAAVGKRRGTQLPHGTHHLTPADARDLARSFSACLCQCLRVHEKRARCIRTRPFGFHVPRDNRSLYLSSASCRLLTASGCMLLMLESSVALVLLEAAGALAGRSRGRAGIPAVPGTAFGSLASGSGDDMLNWPFDGC